ncbi:MAG TPA: RNA polymerase sigma factor [Ktedonobacteraceae bacterium]
MNKHQSRVDRFPELTMGPCCLENTTSSDEKDLLQALRRGDEEAFVSLLNQFDASLRRIALLYVHGQAIAEEVVQETWLGVLRGLSQFEGRSSLKTWIFRILINCAQKRGKRESQSIPFSAMPIDEESAEMVEDSKQFLPADHPTRPGGWASFPQSWEYIPENRLLSQELRFSIEKAIEALPQKQREVIVMRDLEGWGADEVCSFLEISKANQRVLLHRARTHVRHVLETYLKEE